MNRDLENGWTGDERLRSPQQTAPEPSTSIGNSSDLQLSNVPEPEPKTAVRPPCTAGTGAGQDRLCPGQGWTGEAYTGQEAGEPRGLGSQGRAGSRAGVRNRAAGSRAAAEKTG